MLLEGKVAIIHAAAGQIGRSTAERLAREGAQVWLAGRDRGRLETIADALRRGGMDAKTIEVDALDSASIDESTAQVVRSAGRLDIEFNAIAVGSATAILGPATEVTADRFLESFQTVVLSQFLTARAAARHMLAAGQGSIVLLTATPGRGVAPLMAGHSDGVGALGCPRDGPDVGRHAGNDAHR
jgi:3-oxoacyl-[acyl-carrier protein] reductase